LISTPKHVAFLIIIIFNIHTSLPNITVSCPTKLENSSTLWRESQRLQQNKPSAELHTNV